MHTKEVTDLKQDHKDLTEIVLIVHEKGNYEPILYEWTFYCIHNRNFAVSIDLEMVIKDKGLFSVDLCSFMISCLYLGLPLKTTLISQR